jgi:hypothetical protein
LARKRPWEPSPLATLPTLLIALASGEVYSFDLFMDENWRVRRIFAALGSRSRLFFKERGYMTVYSRVGVFNRSSRKAMRRGGWKLSGLVLRARGERCGGWPIVTLSGSAHPLMRRRRRAAGQEQLDVNRLVIRDAKGRPRILASTVESGPPSWRS